MKKIFESMYKEGWKRVYTRPHTEMVLDDLEDEDMEELYGKYYEKFNHLDTLLSNPGNIIKICHSPDVVRKDVDKIIEALEKNANNRLSIICDLDCEPHPSDCHECKFGEKFSSKCFKCDKKHCDGEFCQKGHPWALEKYQVKKGDEV